MDAKEKKRAIRFANFIATKVPKKNFDIGSVCHLGPKSKTDVYESMREHECGSAGCLIGWLPIYSPAVFKYSRVDLSENSYFVVKKSYQRERHYLKVGMRYFGLTLTQAKFCFSPVGYTSHNPTPKEAASHLLGIATKDPKIMKEYVDFCYRQGIINDRN